MLFPQTHTYTRTHTTAHAHQPLWASSCRCHSFPDSFSSETSFGPQAPVAPLPPHTSPSSGHNPYRWSGSGPLSQSVHPARLLLQLSLWADLAWAAVFVSWRGGDRGPSPFPGYRSKGYSLSALLYYFYKTRSLKTPPAQPCCHPVQNSHLFTITTRLCWLFTYFPFPLHPCSLFQASKLVFSTCASFFSVPFLGNPHPKNARLPFPFFLLLRLPPSATVASLLTYTITSLFSPPHPSLLLSSPLFPAPRYRQSLLSPGKNTLSVLCGGRPRKTGSCCDAVRDPVSQGGMRPLVFTLLWSLCWRDRKGLYPAADDTPFQWNYLDVMRGDAWCVFGSLRTKWWFQGSRKCENCFCSSQALFCCLFLFPQVFWLVCKSS